MTTLAPPRPTADQAPAEPRDLHAPGSATRRSRVWLMRLAALAVAAGSVAYDLSILAIIPVLFVLIVPFEKLFPRHRGQKVRRPLALLDIRWALMTTVSGLASITVGLVVAVLSFTWLPGLALRPLVSQMPGWLAPIVGIALFDLAVYWGHRWSHEVPALWRFHSVHHSTEHLDWISGFRAHPFDGIIIAPVAVFLIAAGFDPTFTGALALVQFATGLFLHANVRWKLRPLQRVIITPEFHHWHHAYEPEAHNSNYSIFLPLWDIVFGTYYMPRNKRPVRYGVSLDVPPTMRGQLAFPFRGVRSPLAMLRHPWRSTRDGVRCTRAILRDVWRSTTRPRTRYAKPGEPYPWTEARPASVTDVV